MERQFLFSLFLCVFQPILAWNEAIMVFYNFLNFFAFFFTFLLWVGLERHGTIIFIFFLSHSFPTYFGLKWCHNSIFWIFLLFFWNFLFSFGTERNGVIIFIFSPSQHFPTYFGLGWSHNGIFQFFQFFLYFLFRVG